MFIEPIYGDKFYGREEVLATLHKRVYSIKGGYRQNLALTGQMLAGKSSILRHFLNTIDDPDIIPVYIEMGDEEFHLFCVRFMATLLYQYLRSEERETDGSFDSLRDIARGSIPVTVRQIDSVIDRLDANKPSEAYETLLDLTSTFKHETGKNCVVILDEFHNLSNFKLKKPFQTFGKYIMVQKNTMYIVSSSQKTILKEILSKKLSLLFGNFEVVDVNGFDAHTSRSFIAERSKDAPISEDITRYIIHLSEGNPFYLETILKNMMSREDAVLDKGCARERLFSAIAATLYDSNGPLNQYFTNTIHFFIEKKSRRTLIPVLFSLARGNRTVKALRKDLDRSGSDLGKKLERLQAVDLVSKSGVFYKIEDGLFEFWLRNVYDLKQGSVIDDMDFKYLEFKNALAAGYDEYTDFCAREVPDIVCDLFRAFNNEKIQINMYERKMPAFESVDRERLSGNVHEILGRTVRNTWMCHVKVEDLADDNDVLALTGIKERDGHKRIARKIIVPLAGIEHNAFLLAKEHNIWVWDIDQLNEILFLYGKHKLVP